MMKLEFKIGSQVSKLEAKSVEIAIRRGAALTRRLCCGVDADAKNGKISTSTMVQLAEKASELPVNFRFFDAGASIDSFKSLVENIELRELNTRCVYLNHKNGKPFLLWRASAVYCEATEGQPARLAMVFGFSHIIGDGLSLGIVARDIAAELDWILEVLKYDPTHAMLKNTKVWERKVSTVDPKFDRLPMRNVTFLGILGFIYLSCYFFWRGIREKITGRSKYQRAIRTDPPAAHEPLKQPVVAMGIFPKPTDKLTIFSRFHLSEEQTLKLLQNCRNHKTTVSGALLASAALAYYGTLPEAGKKRCKSLSWMCTVSDRGYLREEDRLKCGNFSNMVIIKDERLRFPKPEEKDYSKKLWNFAAKMINTCKAQYYLSSKASGMMLRLFSKLPTSWIMALSKTDGKVRADKTHALEFTNLGNVVHTLFEEDMKMGNLELASVEGGLNRDSFGGRVDFGLIVATHSNILRCSIDAESAFFTQEQLDAVAADMQKHLEWFVANSGDQ